MFDSDFTYPELDTADVRVFPLAKRKSMTRLEQVLIPPSRSPVPAPEALEPKLESCVAAVRKAREKNASVILMYGAHLIKNGGSALLIELMRRGWVTHLATNGAGVIHDWEFAYCGVSTENVRENVAHGVFGAWNETGKSINLALMIGGLYGRGFGESIGCWVMENGGVVPEAHELMEKICQYPSDATTAARADLFSAVNAGLATGRHRMRHQYKQISVSGNAWKLRVPLTVHPGIGYDIFTVHPLYNGAVVGRAGGIDFKRFNASVENLTDGVVLSVGSAIMAPQVFEKSLSVVHNLRFQKKRPAISGHSFYVVDLHEGSNWDWSKGEPPKTSPEYYLRFCKSFSRMGGEMNYLCCDNTVFIHQLLNRLGPGPAKAEGTQNREAEEPSSFMYDDGGGGEF